jgi:uncharacterized protein (TIGR00299 family) protein
VKLAYFDCIAGASGDMILAALLDVGLPEATLRDRLAALKLDGFYLDIRRVVKNGLAATKVDVIIAEDRPERYLAEIEALVEKSDLPQGIIAQAKAIFRRLAEVEAAIHGTPVEQVHLHELGGIDTIVDVVGVLSALDALGITEIYSSPLPLGRGFVRSAHGQLPLPAPATVALLKGIPVVGSEIDRELVTPTGAALLSSLAKGFGPLPAMTLLGAGYGAGSHDLPIPNVVRVMIGEKALPGHPEGDVVALLETNIDDLNPEIYDYVMSRLFAAGALDVFLTPIQMKKNRPATLLRVICRPQDSTRLTGILFAETSTLGVREQLVTRSCLPRSSQQVNTPYGPVRIKVAHLPTGETRAAPEYEDCRRLAEAHGVPLQEVYRAAGLSI